MKNSVVAGFLASLLFTVLPSLFAAPPTEVWRTRYTGTANADDAPRAIALDARRDVFVTGTSPGVNSGGDYYTAKYSGSTGALIWETRYNGPAGEDDEARAIVIDRQGNAIVTGTSTGIDSEGDIYTAKYAGGSGALLWERRFDGRASELDLGEEIGVDAAGNVFVAGYSTGFGTGTDIYVAKYSGATGLPIWERIYDGIAGNADAANSLAVASNGDVVIAGFSGGLGTGSDFYTARYSGTAGDLIWEVRHDGPANNGDAARAVELVRGGNVLVTGYSTGIDTEHDLYTVKYSFATGALIWERRYDGPVGGLDEGFDVAADSAGNVLVTGASESSVGLDYYTAKYARQTGALIWEQRYNGPADADDESRAIAVHASDDAIVAGFSTAPGGNPDFFTRRYDALTGAVVWELREDGTAADDDRIELRRELVLDGVGGVLLTGYSTGLNSGQDYLTIKYRDVQTPVVRSVRATPQRESATLIAEIIPNGASVVAFFQYGETADYDQATPATQLENNAPVKVLSQSIEDLDPNTVYHFRVVVFNSTGTVFGNDFTFTTLNSAPSAGDDQVVFTNSSPMLINVLGNDTDADGNALRITKVSQGRAGTVTHNGAIITYSARATFTGSDRFTYTVADGFGGTSSASVVVAVQASLSTGTVLVASGGQVPGEPEPLPGETRGTTWSSFGIPSRYGGGATGFLARLRQPSGESVSAVFGGIDPRRLVTVGDLAPGAGGAKFSRIQEPVFNGHGYAFVAQLAADSAADVASSNDHGLWSSDSGQLQLVAREGADIGQGKRLQTFLSVALPENTGPVFVAKLEQGPGGVTAADDLGVWWIINGALNEVVREGQPFEVAPGSLLTVKRFSFLSPVPGSPGQPRAYSSELTFAIHLTFSDGSEGLLRNTPGSTAKAPILWTGSFAPPAPAGAKVKRFGVPSIVPHGLAFGATLTIGAAGVTSANDEAIYASFDSDFSLVAREGQLAPGAAAARFTAFRAPAMNNRGAVAFTAGLSGAGVTPENNEGLWSTASGTLALVAREGDLAPGVTGARFANFTSFALPVHDSECGPVFLAKIEGAPSITNANNVGLWATDAEGVGHLLARTGTSVELNGTLKVMRSISVLSPVAGSPGQGRAIGDDGVIVYRATFNDGSQAVLEAQSP